MVRSSFYPSARSVLLTLVILCTILLTAGVSAAAAGSSIDAGATGNGIHQAPVNPAFDEFNQKRIAGIDTVSVVTRDGHKLGLLPSLISRPGVRDIPISASGTGSEYSTRELSTTMFPSSYDLRTANKVSPVRDQGNFGTCWAFATFGSLESTLMPVTPVPDFSEKNLANRAGFDISIPNGGGNMWMSTAYLTRWDGPVNESRDTYPTGVWTSSAAYPPAKHVQSVIFFPGRTPATSTNNIKNAVISYGAVYSSFFWNSSYLNDSSASYYLPYNKLADPWGPYDGGHAVTIIGWNDNYAAGNFSRPPGGNGAWLVKNSWGTGWGQNGYFWISYYDKYFGSRYHNASAEAAMSTKDTAQFRAEPATNYRQLYSYDKLGDVFDYYLDSTPKQGSFANEFTATAAGNITAVGFYTTDMNVPVTVRIYKNPTTASPITGTLAGRYDVTLPNMGYNTVKLPVTSQAKLANGQKFSVVITVRNPTNDYYIPVEGNYFGYSSGVVSTAGQGFAKNDSGWYDWSVQAPDSHICVKAYMK